MLLQHILLTDANNHQKRRASPVSPKTVPSKYAREASSSVLECGAVVVGSGPVGLMTALALQPALAPGAPVLIIEARPAADSNQRTQALRLQHKTVEALTSL